MSPVFDRIGGFTFYFVKADLGEPPHAHVAAGNNQSRGDAKIWLDSVSVVRPGRLNETQLRKAVDIAEKNQANWLRTWKHHADNR